MDPKLASLIEQLRDVYTGRATYNSTHEWVDNLDAVFKELSDHPDVAFEFTPQAEAGKVNDAREIWDLVQNADGAGLVLTDDNLLAEHFHATLGVEPEDVYPDYENPEEDDGDDLDEGEEAEEEDADDDDE